MVNQQLLDYINQQKAGGVSVEELRTRLMTSGWPEPDVNEALGKPEEKQPEEPKPAETKPEPTPVTPPPSVSAFDLSAPGRFDLGTATPATAGAAPVVSRLAATPGGEMPTAAVTNKPEKSGKLWLIILFGVLILAGGGFGIWLVSSSKKAETPVLPPMPQLTVPTVQPAETASKFGQEKGYADAANGFQINPPANWVADSTGAFGTMVMFTNPEADSIDDASLSAQINVVAEQIGGVTLAEYVEKSKELMAETFTNHVLVSENEVEVAGKAGVLLETTFDQGEIKRHNLQLILVSSEKAYIVTGGSLDVAWEKHKTVVEDALLSFEVK